MRTDTDTHSHSNPSSGAFDTTHWSVVFTARDGDSAKAFAALERLCRSYWRPVYAYIRRDGCRPADAQDLTQEFFRRFIEKEWIDHVQHQRGKFRSFLLTFLKHFLSDERDRADRASKPSRTAQRNFNFRRTRQRRRETVVFRVVDTDHRTAYRHTENRTI